MASNICTMRRGKKRQCSLTCTLAGPCGRIFDPEGAGNCGVLLICGGSGLTQPMIKRAKQPDGNPQMTHWQILASTLSTAPSATRAPTNSRPLPLLPKLHGVYAASQALSHTAERRSALRMMSVRVVQGASEAIGCRMCSDCVALVYRADNGSHQWHELGLELCRALNGYWPVPFTRELLTRRGKEENS